jgi:hypothetical protein
MKCQVRQILIQKNVLSVQERDLKNVGHVVVLHPISQHVMRITVLIVKVQDLKNAKDVMEMYLLNALFVKLTYLVCYVTIQSVLK